MYEYEGEWYRENDNGEEVQVKIPMKWEICYGCKGEGKRLCDGLRGIAFSMEEFNYEFDEDEQYRYFNGGYDACCSECRGTGKIKVVDRERLEVESPELIKEIDEYYENEAHYAAIEEAERRMGC